MLQNRGRVVKETTESNPPVKGTGRRRRRAGRNNRFLARGTLRALRARARALTMLVGEQRAGVNLAL